MITQAERIEDSATTGGLGLTTGNVGYALVAVAGSLGLWGGRTVATEQVDGYGLLYAFPAVYWVGVCLAVLATLILFRVAANEGSRYAAPIPVMWLVILHTAPQLAHRHVRFPVVWTHMGFVRLIDENNTADVLVDARLSWPGFFGTFVAPLAQLDARIWESVLRLWPTYITGGTALLVAALARRSYPTIPLIGPLSALAYVLLAWTGQDYFSPESVGYLGYVAVLVILESGPLRTSSAWSAAVPILPRFATSGGDRPASRSTAAVVALVILSFGAIVSHPLAPLFICMSLVILALYGRTMAWRLLLFVGSAYLLWFLVSAEPWWSTQTEELLQQFAGPTGSLGENTTEQVITSSPQHLFVTRVRTFVGLSTVLYVLMVAVAMAGDRFRRLRPAIPLVPLAAMPALALVLLSYNGAIVTRVLLFTLPMASILIARTLAALRPRYLPIVVALLAAVLGPLLLIARFGHESFEFTTATDRGAIEAAYARAEDDTLFVADNGYLPWRDQTIGDNDFVEVTVEPSEAWIADIRNLADELGKERIIVVLTESQRGYRIHGQGDEADSLDRFAIWLADRPEAMLLYNNEGAWAIEL